MGKMVERTPVWDLARSRRARTVDSLRVGMRKWGDWEVGELERSVSLRMDCGDGGWPAGPGAGEAWVCEMVKARRERRAVGRYILRLLNGWQKRTKAR